MEGGYEDAPGLYTGDCSAQNNSGTYIKRDIFSVAGAWLDAEREKNNAGGGWGAVGERPP
jgi:hypothetical protein